MIRDIPEAHRTDIIAAHGGSTSGIQTIARDEGLVLSTQGKAIGEIARSALGDTHDFVLARSTCGERELRAMSWTVGFGIGVRHGKPYCDTCAIRRGTPKRLALREMTCGWISEMQMHAPQMRANSV